MWKTESCIRTCAIRQRTPTRLASGVLAIALAIAPVDQANSQGIGYTLTPAFQRVQWADALGLGNGSLYGGQVSIDFERAFSLQPYYFQNSSIPLSTSGFPPPGASLLSQDLKVRSYGVNLLANFGQGAFTPFVKLGGGIVDFEPSAGASSEQIALNAGGGLRFDFGERLYIDLFAEDLMFRVDRFALAGNPSGATIPSDPDRNELRHNFVLGVGVGIPLGAAHQTGVRERYTWGLGGFSFALEPMFGRFYFDETNTYSLPDQDVGGLRAGFDFGRYLGLSAFYARDWNDGFDTGADFETWGGEAEFRLNTGTGLTPFLLVGGAELEFDPGFATPLVAGAAVPSRETSFILGGGITIPLSERIGVQLTARDFLLSSSLGIDTIASPSDLVHNWLFSAGLRFNIGGTSGSAAQREAAARQKAIADSLALARTVVAAAVVERRVDTVVVMQQRDTTPAPQPPKPVVDSAARARDAAQARAVAQTPAEQREMMRDVIRTELSERDRVRTEILAQMALERSNDVWLALAMGRGLVLPERAPGQVAAYPTAMPRSDVRIPTTKDVTSRVSAGEVAQRPPGAPGDTVPVDTAAARTGRQTEAQALRDSIRADIRAELQGVSVAAMAKQDTVIARMDSMNVRLAVLEQREDSIVNAARVADSLKQAQAMRGRLPSGRRPWTFYTGMSFSEWQTVFGGRLDFGPVTPNLRALHLEPELALGFFNGATTVMGAANLQYRLPRASLGGTGFRLFAEGGAGIMYFSEELGRYDNGFEAVLNFGVGATFDMSRGQGVRPQLFVEYQGVDLFKLNRLLVGIRSGY